MGKAGILAAAVVVVLGGGYLGAAVYSGGAVRAKYEAEMDNVSQTLPFIKIVDPKYDKGLLSSTATYGLRIGCDPQEAGQEAGGQEEGGSAKSVTITLSNSIAHGPFPDFDGVGLARIDTRIVLPPEAPEALRKWVGGMKPDAIRTVIGFDDTATTRIELPAGEVKEDEGSLRWQAIRASARMNGARTRLNYDIDVPEVAFDHSEAGETSSLKLVNLRLHSDSELGNSLLLAGGTGTGSLDSMQFTAAKAGLSVDLNQVKLTSSAKTENDLLGGTSSLTGVLGVKVGERVFKFDPIEMQVSMKRIHAPTMQKISLGFWQELGNICRKTPAELAKSMEGKQAAMLLGMRDLLVYNPEYSLDKIALTYEGKEGTFAYSVAANGVTSEDLQQSDPRALLGKATLKASAKLPVAWLEKIVAEIKGGQASPQEIQAQIEGGLAPLVQAGYVTREGEYISSSAAFEHGQVTVNGKPFDQRALGMAPVQKQPEQDGETAPPPSQPEHGGEAAPPPNQPEHGGEATPPPSQPEQGGGEEKKDQD